MTASGIERGLSTGLLTVSQIGASNRVGLLHSLVRLGPASRSDLARLAKVPRGSIAPIVTGLIEDGFLVELEPANGPSKMGKPSRPLWFGPRVGHSCSLRVEATGVDCARVDQRGQVHDLRRADFPSDASAAVIESAVLSLAETVAGRSPEPLTGLGLAWPAVWDPVDWTVLSCTPIPALVGSGLARRLGQACGLDLFLEDDARALAIGQRWFGEARDLDNFSAVQISTGIGAGLMVDGKLFSVEGRSPEVGHMVVDLDGAPCRCGRSGCWETLAALGWLRQEARRLGLPQWETALPGDIVAWSSPAADQLLDSYARNIAIGLVNLANTVGLHRFLLHGEVVSGGEPLLRLLRRHIGAQTTWSETKPTVEFSELNQTAALLGAAVIPLVHTIERA
ncbi:MAG: ROK family transcriptional regulator [Propionibacteriaceae bacterium]|nr:ROK family transcriptional regulator [Propionibacteriaceae bacterium]